jgi:hypothetical protein
MVMNIQTLISNQVKAERAEEMKTSRQLTLGEAILKMESLVNSPSIGDRRPTVRFNFEYLFPIGLDSWRGSYCELAINFEGSVRGSKLNPPDDVTFLKWLKEANGKTYTGYKGGEYLMGKTTPLWVANYGNSGNTMLVDIKTDYPMDWYEIILVTEDREES